MSRRAVFVILSLLLASIVFVGAASGSPTVNNAEIRFVDVGQGDGVVMRIGGKVILSDAGQFNLATVDSALRELGATLSDTEVVVS